MATIGIGLPGDSIHNIRAAAEAAAQYNFDSFSVYGDLGDLPPYAALHACADILAHSDINNIGPLGIPVGLQHPEIIGRHALALEEQLPKRSSVGLVRGAYLDSIQQKPATLSMIEGAISHIRQLFGAAEQTPPIFLGGFGPKLITMANRLSVNGVKLGGSTNTKLAQRARDIVDNPNTAIVLGAVSVIDRDRRAARIRARHEVAKYLHVVGVLDPTLDGDEQASLARFNTQFGANDPQAPLAISDSLLDNFALAGTADDALEVLIGMRGIVNRFEFGTPHGLTDRASAIHYIGQHIVNQIGEKL